MMTSTLIDDPTAKAATQGGIRLAFFEGETSREHGDFSHLQVWVYLTQNARLVVATRWRTYNGSAGHSVQTRPAIAFYATERQILDLLEAHGIHKEHLVFEAPDGVSPEVRTIFRRSYSLWTDQEKRTVLAFFFAPRSSSSRRR